MEESEGRQSEVPAGWYPDSHVPGQQRFWDGRIWTEHVAPITPGATAIPPDAKPERKSAGLKTILAILGGLFVVALIGLGSCAIPLAMQGAGLDEESRAYADRIVPEVVTTWDKSALEGELSPEFLEVSTGKQLDEFFTLYTKLGALESLDEAQGQSNIRWFLGEETQITAVYMIDAEFENGPAQITLTLVKHGSEWQVAGFHVSSDYFLEELQ